MQASYRARLEPRAGSPRALPGWLVRVIQPVERASASEAAQLALQGDKRYLEWAGDAAPVVANLLEVIRGKEKLVT